jgi:hypothetical protein
MTGKARINSYTKKRRIKKKRRRSRQFLHVAEKKSNSSSAAYLTQEGRSKSLGYGRLGLRLKYRRI